MWALMVILLAASVQALDQIHHVMTKEELQTTFHVESHDHVPEYEVVRVRRSDEDVKLKAFGKVLKLKLRQSESPVTKRTPVFEATTNSSGQLHYTRISQEEHVGDTYQDLDNQAAILLHKDPHGNVLMEGTIGQHLVVKPVPFSLRQRLGSNITEDDDFNNEIPDSGTGQAEVPAFYSINSDHIVYKRNDPLDHMADFAFMEPDEVPVKRRRSKRHISKREAPFVIYPEILVIVDYDGYRLHGGDNLQIKRYFISFWNGVDLRYRLLKGPKVRISIAGIIISRGRDATPYLERNRVGRDAIDSAAALTDMGKYLFRERRLPVYDIAVAITKYDMCRRRKAGRCTKGTAGFAYVGGACVVNKRLEKVNSVAIIEDTGGFSGIIVAAHEVGHLLGAVHDGSPPPSYLGGPGAEKCRWEDGYIMSDLRHTEKGFKWSSCSIASFHHFLNGETATCLFNSPHEDEALPRVLPGRLLSLDAQCRRDRGTSACFKDDRVCAQLFCFDAGSGYCVAYRPAAEGSPCGDVQYCSNGRCIQEHENVIPDYSQYTPTYARRSDSTSPLDSAANHTTSSISSLFWQNFWTTSATTTQRYTATTSALTKYSSPEVSTSSNIYDNDESKECVDNKMPAGVTCHDFVTRFGKLYCNTVYITKTCCASHRKLCNKTPIKK